MTCTVCGEKLIAVLPKGDTHARVMIIHNQPSGNVNCAFDKGMQTSQYEKILGDLGVVLSDCWFSSSAYCKNGNYVKCSTLYKGKEMLDLQNLRVVLTFGNEAFWSLVGESSSVSKVVGQAYILRGFSRIKLQSNGPLMLIPLPAIPTLRRDSRLKEQVDRAIPRLARKIADWLNRREIGDSYAEEVC